MERREIPITSIPSSALETISKSLSNFTVGFLRIVDSPNGQDAQLLGSGTAVRVGNQRAFLTAHHVLEVLPKRGRLGLILTRQLHQHTIDVAGLSYAKIARGTDNSLGPDLALVRLSSSLASAIGSMKSFYRLDYHRDDMMKAPLEIEEGVWFDNGFVAERTVTEKAQGPYTKVKSFFMLGGGGGPSSPPVERDGYDYLSLPITYGLRSGIPVNFGGMSGGGLWQVRLRCSGDEVEPLFPLLSGVVFYQEATVGNLGGITCHFRKSVYEHAFDAMQP